MLLAKRIQNLLPSPTLSLNSRVKELEKKGISVINLTVGEPDIPTPSPILKAGKKAMDKGETHYTDVAGSMALRQAIVDRLKKDAGLIYTPYEIIVSCGAKHCLYNAMMALVDKGDKVLIPTPAWTTYGEQVQLAGGQPVYIPLKAPFKLTAEDIKKYYTSRVKLIILTSPNNPTGAIIEKSELKKIAEFVLQHHILVISDEIYTSLYYTKQKPVSIASLGNAIKKQTIVINGVSKAYAMTGLRIGYAAGPFEIIKSMGILQGQMTSNPCSISQAAAIEALTGSQSYVTVMRKEYFKRRTMLVKSLFGIKDISIVPPDGAFYGLVSIKKLLTPEYKTSIVWTEKLLQKTQVAVVPGEAFLAPGFIRISFAVKKNILQEGLKRIKDFIYETTK